MTTPLHEKSSVEKIRDRFDQDVQRFSQLETGQAATMDAALSMELISQAAVAATPKISKMLDVGCGAGNNTLKLREVYGDDFAVDLLDLSRPMLDRACERVSAANRGPVAAIQADIRVAELHNEEYDVVLAAAVLHHLRGDDDWRQAFQKIHRILAPGGSVWITDLVSHDHAAIQALMWDRYGQYLESLGGREYQQRVFQYIDQEDSPRSVDYQLGLLQQTGFPQVEVLHKNCCFAAFGAVKGR